MHQAILVRIGLLDHGADVLVSDFFAEEMHGSLDFLVIDVRVIIVVKHLQGKPKSIMLQLTKPVTALNVASAICRPQLLKRSKAMQFYIHLNLRHLAY